jgi:hypothetical protein
VEHSDTLLTIAEIAVALAGFASLVSIIGRRQNDASSAADSIRLQMMLEVAFRNAAFALLPLPFLQLAPSDPIVWRISSGLYIVATVAYFLLRMRPSDRTGERWHVVSLRILISISVIAALANVLGLGGSNAFSLYLANLLLGLTAAGVTFLSVAASIFGVEQSGDAA